MIAVCIDEKVCRACGEVYPLSEFSLRDAHTGRRDNTCKACRREAEKERWAKRREEGSLPSGDIGCFSPADPWAYLAMAVVSHAIREWRKTHPANRGTLIYFFRSELFEDWCDMAGYNPVVLRERLKV